MGATAEPVIFISERIVEGGYFIVPGVQSRRNLGDTSSQVGETRSSKCNSKCNSKDNSLEFDRPSTGYYA
eukprot:5410758-Pyramimonas_sp.AAC.1